MRAIFKRFESLYGVLCLAASVQVACASEGNVARVGPSDCRPRDADSTCATAVAGATLPGGKTGTPDSVLYSGPLAGVPASGYAYWGFDFIADETGTASPVKPDIFVNRSGVPVTITLTFSIPVAYPCGSSCLPRVQFLVGAGWSNVALPLTIRGDTASTTQTFKAGQGYGWVIGLWQASNPRLTVTVPLGSNTTLREAGLAQFPAIASEIPAQAITCDCGDGTTAPCSAGSRFSNGLLGPWYLSFGTYFRAGAFYDCLNVH